MCAVLGLVLGCYTLSVHHDPNPVRCADTTHRLDKDSTYTRIVAAGYVVVVSDKPSFPPPSARHACSEDRVPSIVSRVSSCPADRVQRIVCSVAKSGVSRGVFLNSCCKSSLLLYTITSEFVPSSTSYTRPKVFFTRLYTRISTLCPCVRVSLTSTISVVSKRRERAR